MVLKGVDNTKEGITFNVTKVYSTYVSMTNKTVTKTNASCISNEIRILS